MRPVDSGCFPLLEVETVVPCGIAGSSHDPGRRLVPTDQEERPQQEACGGRSISIERPLGQVQDRATKQSGRASRRGERFRGIWALVNSGGKRKLK